MPLRLFSVPTVTRKSAERSPTSGEAPAIQTSSIIMLSDDDVEKVAGGVRALEYAVIAAGPVTASAQHTYSLDWEPGRLTGFIS